MEDEAILHAADEPGPDSAAYFEFLGVGVSVLYMIAPGEQRAAVVVRHFMPPVKGYEDHVNLLVFLDGENDAVYRKFAQVGQSEDKHTYWATSVSYAPAEENKPGTWDWMR